MEGVLHRHAHLLEREHRVAAHVARRVGRQQVEVTHGVERLGRVLVGEVIELELGAHVHDVAGLFGLAEHAAQAVARISREGFAVRRAHVAEDAGNTVARGAPRQHLERRGSGKASMSASSGAVKPSMAEPSNRCLLEGDLEVLGADGKALQATEHVDEPQAHEADVALLDGAQDEIDVLALIHGCNPSQPSGKDQIERLWPHILPYLCFGRISHSCSTNWGQVTFGYLTPRPSSSATWSTPLQAGQLFRLCAGAMPSARTALRAVGTTPLALDADTHGNKRDSDDGQDNDIDEGHGSS